MGFVGDRATPRGHNLETREEFLKIYSVPRLPAAGLPQGGRLIESESWDYEGVLYLVPF